MKVQFFSDGRRVRFLADTEFCGRKKWRCPAGEIIDGGSIPGWVPGFFGTPYTTRSRRGFGIHDHGYRKARDITRWKAFISPRRAIQDRVLFEVAIVDGERLWRAALFYGLVRLCAWKAWRNHAIRNKAEKPRQTLGEVI